MLCSKNIIQSLSLAPLITEIGLMWHLNYTALKYGLAKYQVHGKNGLMRMLVFKTLMPENCVKLQNY